MFCDVFGQNDAIHLLRKKQIWFIGSSNMRAIYKDTLWLLMNGNIATPNTFKVKNELSYLNDKRLSHDTLHNGRNYQETREFKSDNFHLFFHFLTRLYQDHFIDLIKSITPETAPDVIFINSCLWDLTRWGPNGPDIYKMNILKTLKFLKNSLPAKTRVIWKTALPVSTQADGAIFIDEIKFIVPMLPWHILQANQYAANVASFFNFDVIDLHHYMRLQGHLRVKDGIHWVPLAVRYLTNIFLTHLGLTWGRKLPGQFTPAIYYLENTTKSTLSEKLLQARVDKKDGYFKKLFEKSEEASKKSGLQGIKNKVLSMSRKIFKRKPKNKINRRYCNPVEYFSYTDAHYEDTYYNQYNFASYNNQCYNSYNRRNF